MLGEFPDLESLEGGHHSLLEVNNPSESNGRKESVKGQSEHQTAQSNQSLEGSAKITDYSPEWAYPEGGVKVGNLLLGKFESVFFGVVLS